jgi:UDP-N-acetylmuramate--alanine ligase
MPFYGAAVLCSDDPGVKSILSRVERPVTTYGLEEGAQVRAINVVANSGKMSFTVLRRNGVQLPDLKIVLNLPGEHNVRNALAAISVATELDVPDAAIQKALLEFKGVGRRFQSYGDIPVSAHSGGGSFRVIDDYGHHPVEMAATLAAARGAFVGRRIILAFQPHRYSRTRDCFEDFVRVLSEADALILSDVYAAGESAIIAADGRALARAIRVAGKVEPVFVEDMESMQAAILEMARNGDVVVCMGAGSIGALPAKLVATQSIAKMQQMPANQ